MRVVNLTFVILQVNSLIDSGRYQDISIGDVHDAIEGEGVLRFLKAKCGDDIDLSLFLDHSHNPDFERLYEAEMKSIYDGYAGRERRKFGVENSGLCLILAWTNEIVQRGKLSESGERLEWG